MVQWQHVHYLQALGKLKAFLGYMRHCLQKEKEKQTRAQTQLPKQRNNREEEEHEQMKPNIPRYSESNGEVKVAATRASSLEVEEMLKGSSGRLSEFLGSPSPRQVQLSCYSTVFQSLNLGWRFFAVQYKIPLGCRVKPNSLSHNCLKLVTFVCPIVVPGTSPVTQRASESTESWPGDMFGAPFSVTLPFAQVSSNCRP